MLGAPPRLQQRREIGPRLYFRDGQLDRAHARVPCPHPVAVAVPRAVAGPLVTLRADEVGDLRQLQDIMYAIREVKDVVNVERVRGS